MKRVKNQFPEGWNERQVRDVLEYYEGQTDEESAAEDEAAFAESSGTLMSVPPALVPEVRKLIVEHAQKRAS